MGAPITVGSINFNGGTGGSYTVAPDGSADPLTINNGITLGPGNGPATINAPLNLSGANIWTNNSASTFTVSGAVSNAGNLLTVGGSGNSTINGAISGGGGLSKSGPGSLFLSNTSTYNGNTVITGGTLRLQGAFPSIGIKVAEGQNGSDYSMPATTSAGVVPMANWNNLTGPVGNPASASLALNNNAGAPTGAVVTSYAAADFWSVSGSTLTGNAQLMNGYLDTSNGIRNSHISVTGVPYSSYNVYVYFASDGNGRTGQASLIQNSNALATYNYTTDASPFPGFIQTTTPSTFEQFSQCRLCRIHQRFRQ